MAYTSETMTLEDAITKLSARNDLDDFGMRILAASSRRPARGFRDPEDTPLHSILYALHSIPHSPTPPAARGPTLEFGIRNECDVCI